MLDESDMQLLKCLYLKLAKVHVVTVVKFYDLSYIELYILHVATVVKYQLVVDRCGGCVVADSKADQISLNHQDFWLSSKTLSLTERD